MYGALDVSTSGLTAQRIRLDVISANIANKDSIIRDGVYEPYRRRSVTFATGDPARGLADGVHVESIEVDQSDLTPKYMPDSPYADDRGYVFYPNVHLPVEQMNAMQAMRSYEANVTAAEATKSMINIALQMMA